MVSRFRSGDDFQVVEEPGATYQYLAFNLRDPILEDVKVRRAIAHGIDREGIVKDLLLGHGRVAESMLPAEPLGGGGEPADVSLRRRPREAAPRRGRAARSRRRRPEAAVQDRLPHIDRRRSESAGADHPADAAADRRRGGDPVERVRDVPRGRAEGKLPGLLAAAGGRFGSRFLLVDLHSADALPPEGQNRGYYVNPELDRLIEQARATFDQGQRKQLYGQVQQDPRARPAVRLALPPLEHRDHEEGADRVRDLSVGVPALGAADGVEVSVLGVLGVLGVWSVLGVLGVYAS